MLTWICWRFLKENIFFDVLVQTCSFQQDRLLSRVLLTESSSTCSYLISYSYRLPFVYFFFYIRVFELPIWHIELIEFNVNQVVSK